MLSTLPDELIALILHRNNFTAAEACAMCFVSRRWRELGQEIVWRRLELVSERAGAMEPKQLVLLESPERSHRLGRHVKQLATSPAPTSLCPHPRTPNRGETTGYGIRSRWSLVSAELEFVLDSSRKTLLACSQLQRLAIHDFDVVALRAIIDGLESSKQSLQTLEWTPPRIPSDYLDYPIGLSPIDFFHRLANFPKLRSLSIDIDIPGTPVDASPIPTDCRPLPSLPLASLDL